MNGVACGHDQTAAERKGHDGLATAAGRRSVAREATGLALGELDMAFSAAGNSGRPLADINVTPLVDVMLVLLIIFIVTAPMVTVPIPMQLPQRSEQVVPRPDPPPPIELRVDAGNQLYWNGRPISRATLQAQLQEQSRAYAGNLPELRIDASPDAQYEVMAQVLADANNAHMQRIAFVQ